MYPDVCQGKQKNCNMDIYPNKISQLLEFLVGLGVRDCMVVGFTTIYAISAYYH